MSVTVLVIMCLGMKCNQGRKVPIISITINLTIKHWLTRKITSVFIISIIKHIFVFLDFLNTQKEKKIIKTLLLSRWYISLYFPRLVLSGFIHQWNLPSQYASIVKNDVKSQQSNPSIYLFCSHSEHQVWNFL